MRGIDGRLLLWPQGFSSPKPPVLIWQSVQGRRAIELQPPVFLEVVIARQRAPPPHAAGVGQVVGGVCGTHKCIGAGHLSEPNFPFASSWRHHEVAKLNVMDERPKTQSRDSWVTCLVIEPKLSGDVVEIQVRSISDLHEPQGDDPASQASGQSLPALTRPNEPNSRGCWFCHRANIQIATGLLGGAFSHPSAPRQSGGWIPLASGYHGAVPGGVAQLARAVALQATGRGFESHRLHSDIALKRLDDRVETLE